MHALPKSLLVLTLLLCAGCTRADMVDARRDHILAGAHGWIDVTLHAPRSPGAAAPVANVATCHISLRVNGESQLEADGDLAQADAASSPLGYRFVAPAGTLHTELGISRCVANELQLPLPVALDKDHLALLEFDGEHLAVKSNQPYTPMSLDTLHDEVGALQQGAQASGGALSRLTRLVLASVALNAILVAVAIVAVMRQRRSQRPMP